MSTIPHTAARILAVEDDPVLASLLFQYLRGQGFSVTLKRTGEEALQQASEQAFDLLLLDILLPGCSGLEVLATIRQTSCMPVIFMSALGDEQHRIAGFSQGADDYLPKPFSMAELKVRMEAVLRRVALERNIPSANDWLDPQLICDSRREDVRIGGEWAGLTSTEFRLLSMLCQSAEDVQSKAFLYQHVLHRPMERHDRVLDMHISHTRRKLAAIGYSAGRIETVWGKGYVLTRRSA